MHAEGCDAMHFTIGGCGSLLQLCHIIHQHCLEAGMATKVTDDGQVAIPKWVQDQVGGPGSEVAFRRAADGTIVLQKAEPASALQPSGLDQLVGDAGPGRSTDEIMAMTRGKRKWTRGISTPSGS